MKKVVQIIGNLRGGGAERVCLELHRGLLKLGHDSKIYITDDTKVDYETDENVIAIEKENIISTIRESSPDLIIGHMQNSAQLLQPIKKEKNVFFVFHNTLSEKLKMRNFFSAMKEKHKLNKTYQDANIVAVSKGVEKDVVDTLNIACHSITTIYNPFDKQRILDLSNEQIELDFNYIINVASLNKVKRQDLLLKAYSKLNTDLHLVILGKGRQLENLKNLAHQLGVGKKVHFLGWVPNPYKFMKHADLYVLSSDVEGFGMVLVESLILNTPVVSTDCPSGPNEILIDSLKPYLSNLDDVDDLKSKIELALSNYPKIEPYFTDRFEYTQIASEYIGLIE